MSADRSAPTTGIARPMSTTLAVSIPRDHWPSEADVVAQARELGAALQFPQGFDAATDSGHVPCVLSGRPAGFEYSAELNGAVRELRFESRSSYDDYAAAATVACAIALLCGGRLGDEDAHEVSGDSVVDWFKTVELPAGAHDDPIVRVPVTVLGPQGNSLLRLKLGKVPSGAHLMRALLQTIPVDDVPPGLRQPNSQFVLLVRDAHEIVGIEPMAAPGSPPGRT